jgi:hypothetical protein
MLNSPSRALLFNVTCDPKSYTSARCNASTNSETPKNTENEGAPSIAIMDQPPGLGSVSTSLDIGRISGP